MSKCPLLLFLLFAFTGCTRPPLASVKQTPVALAINTPEVAVTVPGVWQDETPTHLPLVIYSGGQDVGQTRRTISVTKCEVDLGKSETNRESAFFAFLNLQRANEDDALRQQGQIHPLPLHESGGLLVGGYLAVYPAKNHIGFSRTFCSRQAVVNFYFNVDRISGEVHLENLSQEFEKIMATVMMK